MRILRCTNLLLHQLGSEAREPVAPRRDFRPAAEAVEPRFLLSETPGGFRMSGVGRELVPLTDLTESYMGLSGGLYGEGRNDPTAGLAMIAGAAAARIRPLDRSGRPSDHGRVGLIAIGQSTTSQYFQTFRAVVARRAAEVAPSLALVDGAQDGMVLNHWATKRSPWVEAVERVGSAGLDRQQVQVAWIHLAQLGSSGLGGFARRQGTYAARMTTVLGEAQRNFPNLRIAFLSSSSYSGYRSRGHNPEPFAYEEAFAVRDLIARQVAGLPRSEAASGRFPVLLWGPYLWSAGPSPRAHDAFAWGRGDLGPDLVHPSSRGRAKVAASLWHFFRADPAAAPWFRRAGIAP